MTGTVSSLLTCGGPDGCVAARAMAATKKKQKKTSDVSTPFAHEAIAGCFRALLFFVLCLPRNDNNNHFAVGSVIAVTHVKPLWATASAPTLSLSHITRNPPVHFPQCSIARNDMHML
jgi:hypothetical protein